jgi:hypothetical protein
MNDITPFVRHMLLCEDAQANPGNPKKVDVFGLLSAIRGPGDSTEFPLCHSFTVYLALTEGRNEGQLQIVVTSANSGEKIYESPHFSIRFTDDPLRVFGIVIHVTTCSFPRSGLYWVELWYNDKMLTHQPVEVM